MFNTKRVVMDSVRLDKKLKELSDEGYKLRQQLLYCNSKNHFSASDYDEMGIKERSFPLSKIEMVFFCKDKGVLLSLISDSPRKSKMICTEIKLSSSLRTSKLDYALFEEDDFENCFNGEENVSEFELCLKSVLLKDRLEKYGLLVENSILYSIFNNYLLRLNSAGYDSGKLIGLNRSYSSEINKILKESGYECSNSFTFMSKDLFCGVNISFYSDKMDVIYFDKLGFDGGYSCEISRELAVSDFADIELTKPKYQMIMLNGEINSAKFNFNDIVLDDILEGLREEGYIFTSLGVACVRSMLNCITICGFRNKHGYLYVEFFYGVQEDSFLIRFTSSREKLKVVTINNKDVCLIDVNVGSFDSTTFIRGFDFSNFENFSLV